MTNTTPLVWLPADHRQLGDGEATLPALVLGEKYAYAVKHGACAQPLLFALAQAEQIPELLPLVHGVMLTGSPSNVHPSHFEEDVADPALPLDPARDALTLALVNACLAQSVPLLGICRGFQEINVALGGSLHQQVHRVPGLHDHRDDASQPLALQYGPAHALALEPGSALARWAGTDTVTVNSLHGQGINRLAPGLRALARAPDGLIEAFEASAAGSFAVAVQWHPEWHFWDNPFYSAIFQAFGDACRARQRRLNSP